MAVTIAVRGEHSAAQSPDEGVVHLQVVAEGEDCFAVVERALADVRATTEGPRSQGHLSECRTTQVHTWTDRPWGPDGRQLEPVQHASASMQVAFTNAVALGGWVGQVGRRAEVRVDRVEWRLFPDTEQRIARACRSAAVLDARTRAQDYADALDLGTVTVVAISDPGVGTEIDLPVAMAKAMVEDGGSGIDFHPRPIEVRARVEATFVAGQ